MEFRKRRWICYFASLLIVICAGFQYSLSVFQIPLAAKYGWSIPEIAFAYSVLCAVEIFTVIFLTGKMRDKMGIRNFLILGGLLFGGGTLLCAYMFGSILELYLYQGVMFGIGHAIIYPCLTSYVIQLIPEHAGRSSGFVVALYSCGPLIWAPLSAHITTTAGDVSLAFKLLGVTLLVLIIGLSILLREVPEGYEGEKTKKEAAQGGEVKRTVYEFTRKEMLRSPIFYLFYVTFFFAILGGMMLLTQGATIFENGLGLPATIAATCLGILSICNACGRLLFGTLFDRINPFFMMMMLFVLYVAAFGTMAFVTQPVIFIIAACASLFCFGGFAVFLAPMTARLFGVRHLTENFGIMFTIYSLAGFFAPVMVSNLRALSGGYMLVFLCAAVLSATGLVFCRFLRRTTRKQLESDIQNAPKEALIDAAD